MDARDFVLPNSPLVLYLFNPLPEAGLRRVAGHLKESWTRAPRPVWVLYHNPLLADVLTSLEILSKVRDDLEFSVFKTQ